MPNGNAQEITWHSVYVIYFTFLPYSTTVNFQPRISAGVAHRKGLYYTCSPVPGVQIVDPARSKRVEKKNRKKKEREVERREGERRERS